MDEASSEIVPFHFKISADLIPLDLPQSPVGNGRGSYNNAEYVQLAELATQIGERRKRFWNTLVSTVPRTGYTPPQARQTSVLDLACGRCEEGIVLQSFFGGSKFGFPNDNARVIGINKDEVEKAIKAYSSLDGNLRPNYLFINGDATGLEKYQDIPEQADVVVTRHQQVSHDKAGEDIKAMPNDEIEEKIARGKLFLPWREIFQQALRKVTSEGIVLITSYTDIEHREMTETIKKLGASIVIDQQNPYATPLTNPATSIDKHVLIARKGS